MQKKESRIRRSRQTRARISKLKINRLSVHRTNLHIYANIFDSNFKIIISASTVENEVKKELADTSGNGGNKNAASLIGKRVAQKAKNAGITEVAFDRSGFKYHGRVKALAEAAREEGLKF
tara:strand:+ start:1002 stop:1364 length:363 start_codon:yes stop_codon:yes gene_type:complete